jgi:hypothetical protein
MCGKPIDRQRTAPTSEPFDLVLIIKRGALKQLEI